MSDGELLDAREAMSLLGVNETDLQTMVARGSLRAFRSAGTMKFRRDDVLGLKGEKKTDPTIIMPPAAGTKTKPGSGILPTVSSNKSPRGSSRNLPAVKPASTAGTAAARPVAAKPAPAADASTSSDQIILEEFELAPSEVDPAANTQQVTAENTAISGNQTTVDALESGGVTVVEPGVSDLDTASATASAIAPVAVSSAGSGRSTVKTGGSSRLNEATATAPALSRVRPAVGGAGQSASNKRAQATASARTSHPIMTFLLIVTAAMFMYASTIVGVQIFKGNYDEQTKQRVIPPFLADAPVINYTTAYGNLPGIPEDTEGDFKRPKEEPAGYSAGKK